VMWRNRSYFAAVLAACLIAAHLFFCAADILARPSALMGCLAAVLTPCGRAWNASPAALAHFAY
jgi:hypothetical protein